MVRSISILIAAITISLLQVLVTGQAQAQTYSYRTYDQTTGLPGDYLSVIAQDHGGFLWVGLESGLFRYDGFEFHPMLLADTLSEAYPNALCCDRKGTMWIGLTDGSLFTWNNGGTPVRKGEIEADKINRITEGPDGRVWIVTQTQGIYISDPGGGDRITKVTMPEGTVVFDISFSGPDSILVATQDNLHLCLIAGDKAAISYTFPELEYTWVQTVRKIDENHWVAGTDGAGLFTVRRENGIMKASAIVDPAFENLRIPDMIAGPGRTLFVATREAGVIRAEFNEDFSSLNPEAAYNMDSGLPENDIKTIFRDREGNLWIGLFNRGLAAVTTNAFSFFRPGANQEINFIGESRGKVMLGTRNGLYEFDPGTGSFSNWRELNSKTGGSGIVSWNTDEAGNIWIGTTGDGLWLLTAQGGLKQFYRSMNPGQNRINSVAIDGDNIWIATLNGVILLDRETGKQKAAYTTWEMLPHNILGGVKCKKEVDAESMTSSLKKKQ